MIHNILANHYESSLLGTSVFCSPCGTVLVVKELFNSDSKTKVYGNLHDLLSNNLFKDICKDLYMQHYFNNVTFLVLAMFLNASSIIFQLQLRMMMHVT